MFVIEFKIHFLNMQEELKKEYLTVVFTRPMVISETPLEKRIIKLYNLGDYKGYMYEYLPSLWFIKSGIFNNK